MHTPKEHRHGKHLLDTMVQAAQGGPTAAENRYIETTALLIEVYEKQQFPIPKVAPEEMIVELMGQRGTKQRDLVGVFNSEAAVSYALSGKRALTVEQIRGLAKKVQSRRPYSLNSSSRSSSPSEEPPRISTIIHGSVGLSAGDGRGRPSLHAR